MEIIQNRYGVDRVIDKIGDSKIRVMGESYMVRTSEDEDGTLKMYDFEGGPCLNVGGSITYKGTQFKIESIQIEENPNVSTVLLEVSL